MLFSTSSPAFVTFCLSDSNHSDRYEVLCHCGFELHFLFNYWSWTLLQIPSGYFCMYSFEKYLFRLFAYGTLVFWLVSCMSFSFIFNINPLSNIWLANIFSYSGCLFTVGCFLCRAEPFNLVQSHLSILAFVACDFGAHIKKLLPRPITRSSSPMFFSSSFIVSGLTFKSLILLLVDFCIWWDHGSFFCMLIFNFPKAIYWRDWFFLILCSWHSCWRSVDFKLWIYFWTLYSVPFIYMSVLMPVSHCFDYCVVTNFEIIKCL